MVFFAIYCRKNLVNHILIESCIVKSSLVRRFDVLCVDTLRSMIFIHFFCGCRKSKLAMALRTTLMNYDDQ